MRILKVWDSEYPWDVRAEKVCRALTDRGHEVHMVARNRDGRPRTERLPECTVHRMGRWSVLGSRLDRASQFPAFFNPRWVGLIQSTARSVRADLILVRDLPLAPAAIVVGRRRGLPVVLDMAENYPAMIRDLWTTGATRIGDRLVRNPSAVAAVERWVLQRVDHVLVVVEESRDRLLAAGVREDAITIVGNTPGLDRVEEYARLSEGRVAERDGRDDRPARLVYLGLMEEARGVGLAIEAVAAARAAGAQVMLDLIGDGRALDRFRASAARLGLNEEAVRFRGFLPYRDALAEVALADAGLIPHYANESWETTIPNKLFDYMSLGLPVIASDVTPVARVLAETGAGTTFHDRDAADLARVMIAFAAGAERAAAGAAGLSAIRARYHWELDAERLERALQVAVGAAQPGVDSAGGVPILRGRAV